MRSINVFIKGKKETLTLQTPIPTYASAIAAKEVTVFWNFNNITNTLDNRKFTVGSVEKSLNEGYWDFQQIKERLKEEKIELESNVYNNTCTIENKNGDKINLKKFGELLGFPENKEIAANTAVASPKPVDVNHGLKWLTVSCSLIDSSTNTDLLGNPSDILAFLPITPGTRLNSNCHIYERDAYAWRRTKTDVVKSIEFTVKSNIDVDVNADILMTLAIE